MDQEMDLMLPNPPVPTQVLRCTTPERMARLEAAEAENATQRALLTECADVLNEALDWLPTYPLSRQAETLYDRTSRLLDKLEQAEGETADVES